MKTGEDLEATLNRIDGRGYKGYKGIRGEYDLQDFTLFIDHIQGDPFAAPSRFRVRVDNTFPEESYKNKSREVALRDFLTRKFVDEIPKNSKGKRGSGKGGLIKISKPVQEILERTSVIVTPDYVEARFSAGLPAFGRRIAGRQAAEMLLDEVPDIADNSLFYDAVDKGKLDEHLEVCEDADCLRSKLDELGLIAFVADGSLLPRMSGIDPRPLKGGIPFKSPENLRMEVELPNRTITGMAVTKGITLIVGGGYHGKSTLMNAIELGVYNHIPGDGREFVVSNQNSVKIRAEDGRGISRVDISPFINILPQEKDTTVFSTENASGSTSQAANIIEALEAGAEAILIDEDTSATNFMIRDERMQELVPKSMEPITPYIDKARQMFDELGVSTILVVGGSGEYFDIADRVLCMIEYEPHDMTEKAKKIAEEHKSERKSEGGGSFGRITDRSPIGDSIDPHRGRKVKIRARGTNTIMFGRSDIDLNSVEQIVDSDQTNAIADALVYARKHMDGRPLGEVLDMVMGDMEGSLDAINPRKSGSYARFRRFELAAALNRLRTLRIS
jgi:predicted ABC-class ATPase